ncbi:MAG: hypothetical protein LUB59_03725 [Candidatus Gastranaerophilales bacterium]|nr:hypothetical protein [Candidatus Gastranaerophilales bacterium]
MANVFDNYVGEQHIVCESSLLKATSCGHILSMIAHKDMDNGTIVTRGDWVEDQVFNSADYSDGDKPYLVLTTPIAYNSDRTLYQDECYFYNAEGEVMRCYELVVDDIFTVSEEAITALADEPVAGNYVTVSDGLYVESEAEGSGGLSCQILEKVAYTNYNAYRLHVRSVG